jgi:hypothetical protein
MISSLGKQYLDHLVDNIEIHDVSRCDGVEEILMASGSDYHVGIGRLMIADTDGSVLMQPDGTLVSLDTPDLETVERSTVDFLPESYKCKSGDYRITVRENRDGSKVPFEVVRSQYSVTQNEELVNDALELVSSSGDAGSALIYAGNYEKGRKFFVGSSIGDLAIDIGAYRETFVRTIEFATGHDRSLAHWTTYRYANPDTGVSLETIVKPEKHYRKVGRRVDLVVEVLQTVRADSAVLVDEVQQLAKIQLPRKSDKFALMLGMCAKVIVPDSAKKPAHKVREEREIVESAIRDMFNLERHSGMRGANGWALYTAFVEARLEIENSASGVSPHHRHLKSAATSESNRNLRRELLKIT